MKSRLYLEFNTANAQTFELNESHFFSSFKENQKWLDWEEWSSCSASCGTGTRRRQRICVEGDTNRPKCPKGNKQIEDSECKGPACPGKYCIKTNIFTVVFHDYVVLGVPLGFMWQWPKGSGVVKILQSSLREIFYQIC